MLFFLLTYLRFGRKKVADIGVGNFGGDSVAWTGWGVFPSEEEMPNEFPISVKKAIPNYYEETKKLLNFVKVGEGEERNELYDVMHSELFNFLQNNIEKVPSLKKVKEAYISRSPENKYKKLCVVKPFLQLIQQNQERIDLITECKVEKIILDENDTPTALQTSKGNILVNFAKIIISGNNFNSLELVLNSFKKQIPNAGKRYSAHLLQQLVVRIPRSQFPFADLLHPLELSQFHIYGENHFSSQRIGKFHIQFRAISDSEFQQIRNHPEVPNAFYRTSKYFTSNHFILFNLTSLGEIDYKNPLNFCEVNLTREDKDSPGSSVPTTSVPLPASSVPLPASEEMLTNSLLLHCHSSKFEQDLITKIHESSVEIFKTIFMQKNTEYYSVQDNQWKEEPSPPILHGVSVHPCSSLWMGESPDSIVDENYKLRGVNHVYVTGTCLWPSSGSLNPTALIVAMALHLVDSLIF